jgi:hypothetical protein
MQSSRKFGALVEYAGVARETGAKRNHNSVVGSVCYWHDSSEATSLVEQM